MNYSYRSIIISLLFCLASVSAQESNVQLHGRVVDVNGNGVPAIGISLLATQLQTVTDSRGEWNLSTSSNIHSLPPSVAISSYQADGMLMVDVAKPGRIRIVAVDLQGRTAPLHWERDLPVGLHALPLASLPFSRRWHALHVTSTEYGVLRKNTVADILQVTRAGIGIASLSIPDVSVGRLDDLVLVQVVPLLAPANSGENPTPFYSLLGQSVSIDFRYDAQLWRPAWLRVGSQTIPVTSPPTTITLQTTPDTSITLELATRLQTVHYIDRASWNYGDLPLELISSSGLPITLGTSTPTVCTAFNDSLFFHGAGACNVDISLPGSALYNPFHTQLAFTVLPKSLHSNDIVALDKNYDGSDIATLQLNGLLPGDAVDLQGIAHFADAFVGIAKPVELTAATLGGSDAWKYKLELSSGWNASILFSLSALDGALPPVLGPDNLPYTLALAIHPDNGSDMQANVLTPDVCALDAQGHLEGRADASGDLQPGTCLLQITRAGNAQAAAYDSTFSMRIEGILTDSRDAQRYRTVRIGSQVWMAENLNVGAMGLRGDLDDDSRIEKNCYNNIESNCKNGAGGYYQWAETMGLPYSFNNASGRNVIDTFTTQGICPSGWHIPRDQEWQNLVEMVGGNEASTRSLRSDQTNDPSWNAAPANNGDSLGFAALPQGNYSYPLSWSQGQKALFWSLGNLQADSYARFFGLDPYYAGIYTPRYKMDGLPVRCLQDALRFYPAHLRATYGDAPWIIAPPVERDGNSGLQLTYSSKTPGLCTIDPATRTVTLLGAGHCVLRATRYAGPQDTLDAALLSIDIDPRPVSIASAQVVPKLFDAGKIATVSGGLLQGVLPNDAAKVQLTLGTALYASADVGTAIPVTVTGSLLSGSAAANYILSEISGLQGEITIAPVTLQITNPDVRDAYADPLPFQLAYTLTPSTGAPVHVTPLTPEICQSTAEAQVSYVSDGNGGLRAGECTIRIDQEANANGYASTGTVSFRIDGRLFDARDQRFYRSTRIGHQIWMSQNLDFGTRVAGTPASPGQSNDTRNEKFCYGDTETGCEAGMGGLYQWSEAMALPSSCNSVRCDTRIALGHHQGMCPAGWHIPKAEEWDALIAHLGGSATAASQMRQSGTGFNALLTGTRYYGGGYDARSTWTYYWEAFDGGKELANYRYLTTYSDEVTASYGYKTAGTSIRCLQDLLTYDVSHLKKTYGDPDFPGIAATVATDYLAALPEYALVYTSNTPDICAITSDGSTIGSLHAGRCELQVTLKTQGLVISSVRSQFTVQPKALSVQGLLSAPTSKTYDRSVAYPTSYIKVDQQYSILGVVPGDAVSLYLSAANYNSPKVASATHIIVAYDGRAYGADGADYVLTAGTFNVPAALLPKTLTVSSVQVQSKTYDGSANATIVSTKLYGVQASDQVQLQLGTATFANANAGDNQLVTVLGSTLIGADASNYALMGNVQGYGNILPVPAELQFTSPIINDRSRAAGLSFTYNATTSTLSPAPVILGSATPDICAYNGASIALTGQHGICTLQASQAASGNYAAASVTRSFAVDALWDARNQQLYRTTQIGNQVWMAQNLNYDPDSSNSWCYQNDPAQCARFGRLYDWATAMNLPLTYNNTLWNGSDNAHQGLCPQGWHLPSDAEWTTLELSVGLANAESSVSGWRGAGTGYALKSTTDWADNGNGSDAFGFTALPGGQYSDNFVFQGTFGEWWSSSELSATVAWNRGLYSLRNQTDHDYDDPKHLGYSVRCLRNTP